MSHHLPPVACHAATQDLADIYVSAVHRAAHLEPEPNPYSLTSEPWYDAEEVNAWLDELAVSALREFERQCGHWDAEQLKEYAAQAASRPFTVYSRTIAAWSAYADEVIAATAGTRWTNTLEFAPGVHAASRTSAAFRCTPYKATTRQLVTA